MNTINVLFITDKFIKYDLMYEKLEKALDKLNYKIIPDVIATSWPDLPFEYCNSISEYINVDAELLEKIAGKEIILTHVGGIKRTHIEKADKLKIIGCIRSLPVNVDLKAIREKNIKIIYAPGRSTEAVAEFTLGLIISIRRKIFNAHLKLKKGIWDNSFFHYDSAAPPFKDTVIGIIGFGYIGKKVCKLLKPFNCKILVFDPFVDNRVIINNGATPVNDLKELLSLSDIITIHARPPDLCTKIIGEQEIDLMKSSAYLINTSRGYLVDYEALYKALKKGKISGAAIDTYDVEPINIKNPLLSLENVIITPHIAGATKNTAEAGLEKVCEGIGQVLTIENTGNLCGKI